MIVTVAGLEQFCGDMKRRYRSQPIVSDDPERHHTAFAEQLEGAALVDSGIIHRRDHLVTLAEVDPRRLVLDMVELRDGRTSYRLYELLPCPHSRPNYRMCPHCMGF